MAAQKQDFVQALRCYQRAYRLDSDCILALKEIVPLAFSQDRTAEGVRYATILAEKEPGDPEMLHRLAAALVESGDDGRALKLYEKAAEAADHQKPSANQVQLWKEMGTLYLLNKQYEPAADYFGRVMEALENPEKHGLDDNTRRKLTGSPDITYRLFGDSFLESDNLDQALTAYQRANVFLPSDGVFSYEKARIARSASSRTSRCNCCRSISTSTCRAREPGPMKCWPSCWKTLATPMS